ncbi:MAG: oligosaccharide flippase family protein [Candidatus Omnitrophota bacterium]
MSISKNSSFVFASQCVIFFTSILAGIVVTRTLGPTNRGIYFLVLTINAFIINIANVGIRFTNTYMLSKGKYNINEVNSNSILIAGLISAIAFIGYFLSGGFINARFLKEIRPLYIILSISLIPFALYSNYWRGIMAGLNKFFLISVMDVSIAIIGLFLSIAVVLKWGLNGVIWLWFITSIVIFLLELFLINKIERIKLKFSWKCFKESISFGFVGHLGNIAYHIYSRIDVFIVNFFLGVTGVGFYSLASTIAEKVVFVPGVITTVSNPRLGSSSQKEANELSGRLFRHTLLAASFTALCILIIAPWGIPLLYGKDFLPSVKPLLILLAGMVFMPVSSSISSFFIFHKGEPKVPAMVSWISLFINIPLCVILTTKYGFKGTAGAIALTYLLQFLILASLFLRVSKMRISDAFIAGRDDIKAYALLITENIKKAKLYLQRLKYRFNG